MLNFIIHKTLFLFLFISFFITVGCLNSVFPLRNNTVAVQTKQNDPVKKEKQYKIECIVHLVPNVNYTDQEIIQFKEAIKGKFQMLDGEVEINMLKLSVVQEETKK